MRELISAIRSSPQRLAKFKKIILDANELLEQDEEEYDGENSEEAAVSVHKGPDQLEGNQSDEEDRACTKDELNNNATEILVPILDVETR